MEKTKKKPDVRTRSFLTAIIVIFALMVLTYVLTFLIPSGEYARITDADGNTVIDTVTGFSYTDGDLTFIKWLLSPILVLTVEGSGTLIAVIAFLIVIGGVFNSLDRCGFMKYMLSRITAKYRDKKYKLMAVVILFFMAMGSLIGSFEECVPMIPIVAALAVNLGWDSITGMAMSLLATGCGFAAGVFNPFTVGVAQGLIGLPMFSGAWLRILAFVLIYFLLFLFTYKHAKKIESDVAKTDSDYVKDTKMDKALTVFAVIVGTGIVTVLCSGFIKALQDYTMIIVAVMFLVAGIVSTLMSGMKPSMLGKTFGEGVVSIVPAVLMILMASSIKYTLEQSKILDTLLHGFEVTAERLPAWAVILFIYLVVLIMNFFIASGSAKAFLLIPLITPLAQIFALPTQLCVVAYAFGDGFSNVFYPTNPALLIGLGLADISYVGWAKWSWKFQVCNLLLTSILLLFGLWVGYC